MSELIKTVNVEVPVSTAYNQWTQFEEFPRFMDGVEEIRQLDDQRLFWRTNINAQREEFEATITEQIPDERIAWRSTSGKGNSGVVTFHKLNPSETRVTLQMDYHPEGFIETVGDKLGFMSRQVEGDLKRFKEFIESRGTETGAWRGEISQDHGPSSYQR